MKKLLLIVLAVASVSAASAQKVIRGGGRVHYIRPQVTVGLGAFYNPFYSPWAPGFYSPYYPGAYGPYGHRPSKLDMKIEDIKADYQDKIRAARDDKSVPRRERKQIVKDLKHERDESIQQARKDYYESAFRHRSAES